MGRLEARPAVVNRWYGDWMVSEHTDDPASAVMDAYDAGATLIQVRYEQPCIDCGLPTVHPVGTCDRCQAAASRVAARSPRDLVRRTSR